MNTASKKKGWMGGGTIAGERQRAPRTVGCPRPRVQVTWADERAAHGLTKRNRSLATRSIKSASFPLRCLRGVLHLWGAFQRCTSEAELTSVCARRQHLLLSSSNPPPSPFSSYLSCVCLAGGADGFIAKLPPAGVLTGIKILPYDKRGQRTREAKIERTMQQRRKDTHRQHIRDDNRRCR